jgi:MoxR-like ATPase
MSLAGDKTGVLMAATELELRAGNLPAEVTSFVGRSRELTQIRDALGRYRLVTLRGVGGVGKTRLALRVAAACRIRQRAIHWTCSPITWPAGICC